MKCNICDGSQMLLRKATVEEPYLYTESGLPNVHLAGISVYQCPKCKERSPVIPKMLQLHAAIFGNLVVRGGLLSGAEVRFLRKYTGFPAKEFAVLLRVDASHLSRFENGTTRTLGKPSDMLARIIVTLAQETESNRTQLLDLAKKVAAEQKKPRVTKHPTFKLTKNDWKVAA